MRITLRFAPGRVLPHAIAIIALCASAPALSKTFPEEKFRSEWDQGCPDWPERVGDQLTIEPNPVFHFERGPGTFRFLAKVRVENERGEDPAAAARLLEDILLNVARYPEWVLPGVNEDPDGGRHFVELLGLSAERDGPFGHLLRGPFRFRLLMLSVDGDSTIQTKQERLLPPQCPIFADAVSARGDGKLLKRTFRMYPRPDLLDWFVGELWVLPRPMRSEIRARLVMKPASRIYSLMPDALISSQLRARASRLFENLLEFKRRAAAPAAQSSAATPKTLPPAGP
jgi:hypothetical protein